MASPPEGAPRQGLLPIRVTLLGPMQSGKTSLANAFVNNFCPSVYAQTDDPVLYYRTLCLFLARDRESAEREAIPVLAEVEDTYATDRQDGSDCYGSRRDAGFFYGIFPTKKDASMWMDAKAAGPEDVFSSVNPPGIQRYAPFTHLRSGFMIVFDAGDPLSFDEARQAHLKLQAGIHRDQAMVNYKFEPAVFLVANKVDEHPGRAKSVCSRARQYAKDEGIEFVEVSAYELKKVREIFRKVLQKICQAPELYDPHWRQGNGGSPRKISDGLSKAVSDMHAKTQDCIVQ